MVNLYFIIQLRLPKRLKKLKVFMFQQIVKKIIKMSKKFGVKVIKRPNNLTKSKPSIEFLSWKHAVNILEKNIKFKKFISIPSTAPLRNINDIQKCIKKLKTNDQIVVTAYESPINPEEMKISKSKEGIFFIEKKNSKNKSKYKKKCII